MKTLLVIDSSILGGNSVTRKLTERFADNWLRNHDGWQVVRRDLAAEPLPHLDGAVIGAFFTPADDRNPEQAAVVERSDALIRELEGADAVVVGAPMYNFGVPSQLKAWVDQVARAGETFKYTENGPVGLLDDRPVFVLGARGGVYAEGSPNAAADFVFPYLKTVFGFFGITSVEMTAAEGMALGGEAAEEGLRAANESVDSLSVA